MKKTAKNEENPRKSRVFRPASFKDGRLGGANRYLGAPRRPEGFEPDSAYHILSKRRQKSTAQSGQFVDDYKKQQHPVGMLLLFKYKLLKSFFGLLGKPEFVKNSVFFARPCSYRKFQHLYHIYILGVEFPMCFFGVMVHNSLQPIDFFAVI